MEREEMIEDMARDVCPYGYDEETCFDMHCNDKGCLALSKARDMYDNKGYRKIPDGAVVLTREQKEAIDKGIHDTYLAGKSDGSKETAREILMPLKKLICEPFYCVELTKYDIDELAEKYGVEVEE